MNIPHELEQWRKGVDLIRVPLVKFAGKKLPTLSCVDISRAVLEVIAEVDSLKAQLAAATAQRDELLRLVERWQAADLAIRSDASPFTQAFVRHTEACEALRHFRAQSGQPAPVQQPSLDDVAIQSGECSFFDELPKGPALGRFSASERAELDDLKRKAFKAGEP